MHKNRLRISHNEKNYAVLMFLSLAFWSPATASQSGVQPTDPPVEGDKPSNQDQPEPPENRDDGLGDLGLDLSGSVDLLFEDFDIVISASRSEQRSNMASVPVSILSSEDIHYSGVGELPELFDFVPGVDALRLDRNRWALGVRGLHQTFSDRTLFLVNGRNASNPVYGGVDFPTLPVFLEDIERVEVVRGPGGAAWGANAFNGVVNVIEKDPRDTTGLLLSTRISEHGDMRSNLRFGAADEKFAWRVSAEFNEMDPSHSTNIITSATTIAPAISDDFRRNSRMKFSGVYSIDDSTTLDFGVGASHVERADAPFLAQQIGIDERLDLINAHAKLSRSAEEDRNWYIQWYGTYQDVDRPSLWAYTSFDQSVDGQYSFSKGTDHTITVGGTARFVSLDIEQPRSTDALPAGTRDEQWLGVFVGDRWTINDKWTLESQIRTDWYSETQLDWAGRAALLRSLGGDGEHVLRFALGKAFRTPQTGLRELSSARVPIGGGLFGINVIPAKEIDNEELYSIEVGYSGRLREGLTLRGDVYLQYYQDLTGVVNLPEPAPTVGRSFFTIDNIGAARAWGFEGELKYQHERVTASLWYAYNDFHYDLVNQNARAFRPARHKVGATLRYKPNEWLVLNSNYRFSDVTPANFTTDVAQYHRLDMSASILLSDLHAELQFGVTDLLDETDLTIFDQSATGFSAETPGRSAFVQLHMNF